MQHSVWAVEFIESSLEASASCSSSVVPDTVIPKRVSFRRIWQAKGAKKPASKVTMNASKEYLFEEDCLCIFSRLLDKV